MSAASDHSPPPSPDDERTPTPSRWLWWLHPKVALPLLLFGSLLFAPLMYRGHRIADVPDIGDPFDVAAFGTVDIPPDENAMTQYALAAKLFRSRSYTATDDEDKVYSDGWSHATEPVRKWLDDNQPALAEWRKGTQRTRACLIQPKDFTFETTLDVIQESREFSRLARLQAVRCAHDEDFEEAWGWLRDTVRCSRHVEQHGGLIQRLVGITIFASAAEGIKDWAAHPGVTPELLRTALAEFREADQLSPPDSVALKTEYVVLKNTITDAKSLEGLIAFDSDDPRLTSAVMYLTGEPERSRRAFQHVFGNYLSEIDKPKRERAPVVPGSFQLYDLPAGASPCLPANQLERVVHSSLLARMTLPAYSQTDVAMQREAAKRAAVSVMLASQLYRRLHGDWPSKVEDLVPDILAEPPTDPLGKAGELMRLKRDGDDLVIYSVGPNGSDDGGNIGDSGTGNPGDAPDQGIRAKHSTNSQSPNTSEAKPPEPN